MSPNRSSGQRPIFGLILASVPGMCASPQSAMLESTGSSERPFAVSMYPLRPAASASLTARTAGIAAALRIPLRDTIA